jgi:hypothetical protein
LQHFGAAVLMKADRVGHDQSSIVDAREFTAPRSSCNGEAPLVCEGGRSVDALRVFNDRLRPFRIPQEPARRKC